MYNNLHIKILLLVSTLFWGADAVPDSSVGMITRLNGSVSIIETSGGKARPAARFVRLRDGDQLIVTPGSELELVYFGSVGLPGRREIWWGPARLVAGGDETASNAEEQVEVETLQPLASLSGHRLGPDEQQSGGFTIRSIARAGENPLLSESVAVYCQLREHADLANRTPEYYLQAILSEAGMLSTLDRWLAQSLERAPDNRCWSMLFEWRNPS